MNYLQIYESLIERAKDRTLNGYSEKHHIQPKCLGGSNKRENIVMLTPEEHYIAHLLLVKMYPGDHRLLWAAVSMTNHTKLHQRNNKLHGWLRRKFSEAIRERMTGRHPSEETREKLRNAKLGKKTQPHTEETKRKMSEASLGRAKSKEHRAALAKAKLGKKRGPRSEEWRRNQSKGIKAAMKDRDYAWTKTDEYRNQQSAQMKRVWAERKKELT
jgi:hypothetical protein